MLQFLVNGICLGSVIAIVGLGFGLIYNTTGVFHLAHGGVYVLAGYAFWSARATWGLPLFVCIPLALVVAAIAGVLINQLVYQPLAERSASISVVMISSIGVQIVLENALALAFGSQPRILRADMAHIVSLGSVILTYTQTLQLIAGVFITVAFWIFLKHSRAGQICRAVSDDETLALVLGIQTKRVHALVFAVGSVLAGAGSILVFLDVGMDPYVGFPAVLVAAAACIIGGLRSFLTPAIGGLILGVTQSLVVWQTSAQWRDPVTFGLLILFILIRKQGLFGIYRRVEEA